MVHGLLRSLLAYFLQILRTTAMGLRAPTSVNKEPNLNPLSWFRGPALNLLLNHDPEHFIHLIRFLLNSFVMPLFSYFDCVSIAVCLCSNLAIMISFSAPIAIAPRKGLLSVKGSGSIVLRGQLLSKTQHL